MKSRRSRVRMEQRLVLNTMDALSRNKTEATVTASDSRIWACCFDNEEDALRASRVVSRVMGIASSSPVYGVTFSDLNDLLERALHFFRERVVGKVFAVRARRVGTHNFTSKDVERLLGASLLRAGASGVDLENPQYVAHIEIRGLRAYFYDKIVEGPRGLPIGVEGRALALFSGGIDSPVAAWFAMKRGCEVHLLLFNIAGEKQVNEAYRVARALAEGWAYGYRPKLYVADMRPLVAKILQQAPEEYVVIVLRRLMCRIGEKLAYRIKAKALVTGESLGQVASQTLANLYAIEEAVKMPVLRPLIGFDKEEIVALAKKIGTYEHSVRVEEYCPLGARKTTTRADLTKVREIEERLSISDEALESVVDGVTEVDVLNFGTATA